MIKIQCVIIIFLMFLIGCESSGQVIHLYSENDEQVVTIFRRDNIILIANGKQDDVPNDQYVTLDTRDIDPIARALYICWLNNEYAWQIIIPGSTVIEMNIDTSMYRFSTRLPTDSKNIPTAINFSGEGCNIFDFDLNRLMSETGRAEFK